MENCHTSQPSLSYDKYQNTDENNVHPMDTTNNLVFTSNEMFNPHSVHQLPSSELDPDFGVPSAPFDVNNGCVLTTPNGVLQGFSNNFFEVEPSLDHNHVSPTTPQVHPVDTTHNLVFSSNEMFYPHSIHQLPSSGLDPYFGVPRAPSDENNRCLLSTPSNGVLQGFSNNFFEVEPFLDHNHVSPTTPQVHPVDTTNNLFFSSNEMFYPHSIHQPYLSGLDPHFGVPSAPFEQMSSGVTKNMALPHNVEAPFTLNNVNGEINPSNGSMLEDVFDQLDQLIPLDYEEPNKVCNDDPVDQIQEINNDREQYKSLEPNTRTSRHRASRQQWSDHEDSLLRELVRIYTKAGRTHWISVSKRIGTRSGKQCRERWLNHLRPGIKLYRMQSTIASIFHHLSLGKMQILLYPIASDKDCH
ncbi:SANT/Myb domain [Dillenia turbinata]|uniref:SANT/Myb domain n=1 Tax=Dillenia turbinata TaxID=194707 RepID=A0AAN8Z1B5_9MAGN